MTQLSLGILATSTKENESRLPIHPLHVDQIDADLRARIVLERGYGDRYGISDAQLRPHVAGMRSREEIIATADVVLLPKPTLIDVADLRDGQVLWGWPHTVQNTELTQLAIDHRLTLIAWEAMNHPTPSGSSGVHVFHLNNELAGYCSVLHAMALLGRTGHYGQRLTAVVIGFGSTARGAITALRSLGVHDLTVLTTRDVTAVASPIPSVTLGRLERGEADSRWTAVRTPAGSAPTAEVLAKYDIVVNCVLQDTDAPLMFVSDTDLKTFAPGSLLVDVSCDAGMGFACARPTTFEEPMITVGDRVSYYGVDHSPTYLWNSATWAISQALIPHLRTVMGGASAWERDRVIGPAIDIRDGVIRNQKILSFQGRSDIYPHLKH
jgi:alanine dehydrogenase